MTTTGLYDLAVQVNDIGTACSLMQIIDILRDDGDLEYILKLVKSFVRGVWLNGENAFSTFVVKFENPRRVALPSIRGRYKRNGLTLPQTTRSAKGIEPALRAYASTREYYDVSISHLVVPSTLKMSCVRQE
jgi:hypothetical protein